MNNQLLLCVSLVLVGTVCIRFCCKWQRNHIARNTVTLNPLMKCRKDICRMYTTCRSRFPFHSFSRRPDWRQPAISRTRILLIMRPSLPVAVSPYQIYCIKTESCLYICRLPCSVFIIMNPCESRSGRFRWWDEGNLRL